MYCENTARLSIVWHQNKLTLAFFPRDFLKQPHPTWLCSWALSHQDPKNPRAYLVLFSIVSVSECTPHATCWQCTAWGNVAWMETGVDALGSGPCCRFFLGGRVSGMCPTVSFQGLPKLSAPSEQLAGAAGNFTRMRPSWLHRQGRLLLTSPSWACTRLLLTAPLVVSGRVQASSPLGQHGAQAKIHLLCQLLPSNISTSLRLCAQIQPQPEDKGLNF